MGYTVNEDGDTTSSISERQKKKSNKVLDSVEKYLTKKENKSPTSVFLRRQQRLKEALGQ